MSETQSEAQITFVEFTMTLVRTAAVHLGDLADSGLGGEKPQVNVRAAAQMIDILTLLQEKTKGNLSEDEARFLEAALYELRMRFVKVKEQGDVRIVQP